MNNYFKTLKHNVRMLTLFGLQPTYCRTPRARLNRDGFIKQQYSVRTFDQGRYNWLSPETRHLVARDAMTWKRWRQRKGNLQGNKAATPWRESFPQVTA